MYSPSHCQAGVPMINIQSALRTAPDLCKNVSLQCYLVATVIHIESVHSQIAYIHARILHNMEMQSGKRNIKFGTAMNSACQGIISM